jgi:hypothetical protein
MSVYTILRLKVCKFRRRHAWFLSSRWCIFKIVIENARLNIQKSTWTSEPGHNKLPAWSSRNQCTNQARFNDFLGLGCHNSYIYLDFFTLPFVSLITGQSYGLFVGRPLSTMQISIIHFVRENMKHSLINLNLTLIIKWWRESGSRV